MDDAATRRPIGNEIHESSGFDVIINDHRGKLYDADTCERRLQQLRYIVGDETGLVRDPL